MEYNVSSILSLISHIHTSTQEFTNQRLSGSGEFVSSHGFILYLLSNADKMTMGDIARAINRDKSTTTVLVRKLKAEGLVEEENCPDDSRKKFIFLTEKGQKLNKLTSGISRELLEVCYKDFTDDEKEILLNLLKKMAESVDNSLK